MSQPDTIHGISFINSPDRGTYGDSVEVEMIVSRVLADVQARGDAEVVGYNRKFDKSDRGAFEVSLEERQADVDELDPQTRRDTEFSIANARRYAEAQFGAILPLDVETTPDTILGHCRAAQMRLDRLRVLSSSRSKRTSSST